MHRLVHAQSFDVRPAQTGKADARHLVGVGERRELDELRFGGRLDFLDEVGERKSDPGNDHRPGFDASMPVDPILERLALEDVFEVPDRRLGHFAFDRHRPRRRFETSRIVGRRVFVGSVLVIIVVGRDLFPGVRLLGRAELAGLDVQ